MKKDWMNFQEIYRPSLLDLIIPFNIILSFCSSPNTLDHDDDDEVSFSVFNKVLAMVVSLLRV